MITGCFVYKNTEKLYIQIVEQQPAYLQGCGCDYIQGYLTGRPMPSEQISDFIKQQAPSNVGALNMPILRDDSVG